LAALPIEVVVFALAVTFLAAAVQGVVGMGFAMVSVPILAFADPLLAPVPQLLVTLPLAVWMARQERRHLDFSGIGWIIGGRIPGAVVGVALLTIATRPMLELIIAAAVLAAVAIMASGYHLRRTRAAEVGAGFLSGVSGMVASIGAPALALLYTRDEGPTVRANLGAIFAIGILITISARVVSGTITLDDVRVAALLLPAMGAGYLVSVPLQTRVSQRLLRRLILALSLLGAIALIGRAVTAA